MLRKSLWGFRNNRMAVRFQYECRDADGQWYRSYGNELWEFTPEGLMSRREASINDVKIDESQRRYFGRGRSRSTETRSRCGEAADGRQWEPMGEALPGIRLPGRASVEAGLGYSADGMSMTNPCERWRGM